MAPDYLDDFGFYNSEAQVKRMGEAFRLYRILPRAGGSLDQNEQDWHDLQVYMSGYAYAVYERNIGSGNGK